MPDITSALLKTRIRCYPTHARYARSTQESHGLHVAYMIEMHLDHACICFQAWVCLKVEA